MKVSKVSPKSGFSLIELLVVIAIMAMLVGLALPNYLGARERARDAKRKQELVQLKSALRLYYNDYQNYPPTGDGTNIPGCGAGGISACPVCTSAEFAAGGADGCATIYMKQLPKINAVAEFMYYGCAGGDDFRLIIPLENKSDSDIAASQARCTADCGAAYGLTDYVLCAD